MSNENMILEKIIKEMEREYAASKDQGYITTDITTTMLKEWIESLEALRNEVSRMKNDYNEFLENEYNHGLDKGEYNI